MPPVDNGAPVLGAVDFSMFRCIQTEGLQVAYGEALDFANRFTIFSTSTEMRDSKTPGALRCSPARDT